MFRTMFNININTLAMALCLCTSIVAEETPHAHLEQLRAANLARQTLAKEKDAWASEQQRLQLLIEEARRQISNQKVFIENNNAAIERIHKKLSNLENQTVRSAEINEVLIELAVRIKNALVERAGRLPSGSIERVQGDTHAEASMQFLRSAASLKQALANAKSWRSSLSSGTLNGKRIAYDQISMGHVAAWWVSRDQSKAGIIERRAGENVLHQIEDARIVEAIKSAVAIVHGDRSPQAVVLPIDKRQLQTGAPQ